MALLLYLPQKRLDIVRHLTIMNYMSDILSLISKTHEKGNRFIIQELENNGATGLVPSHGDILFCLYQNGKMTMKDIADRIHRTKPTVTILVNKLETLGYLKRETSTDDSRCTNLILTKKGKDFKATFEKISKELNEMLYQNLSKSEIEVLEKLLRKI